MRSRVSLLLLLFVTGFFVLPLVAQAQGIPFFGPIIPQEGNFASCAAGWGMLITVINRVIALLLTLAIVFVAPLMIAYSGFLFVVNPVDSSGIAKAKGILLHTIVGIVIALAGWMIVAALMAVLYNASAPDYKGGTLGAWSDIISSGGIADDCLQQAGAPPQTGRVPTPPAVVTAPAACSASHVANAQTLATSGITVSSSGNCCDQNNRRCTSLSGMKDETISQVQRIQQKCGGVRVTGGTEVGHSNAGGINHSGGSKIDIATNVDSCITSNTTAAGTRSDGAALRTDSCGNVYARETSPPHWDIKVIAVCSL